ncbi:centriole, cilia and spindle-associated protein isoform X1 [Anarrhichthys ocellatus]|uniref:centriole, cilia and spindle-associated protein isoform X1 n=1 Tax=Anarrhichthys ocellatus TaxID=433405 RepID=UPI0012EDC7BB|nr:centriole, cilia and spindle-associated protein isoform X1 [Anarrhichthys ocellatus]XP_031702512.1 centriole, cilia and spindle-associated protein isoform X1 [Anarrhichthys ocellatus]XP_031702514.1 centriole, cilia and spindle-associated protein isoform X1 [Anarrhichthys ocellatus]
MVAKRIRSEYMKKFKDPKWETYSKCYEEMLKYRLTRRLLEHTHNPWFWSDSDSDSDSGGRSPPPPSKNQVGPETSRDRTEVELEECEGARMDRQQEQLSRATGTIPRLPLPKEENGSAVHGTCDLRTVQHIGMFTSYSSVTYDIHSSQALSLKVPERQKYRRRRERSGLTVKTERETLEEPDQSRVNPPNPQSKHGAPSESGLHQRGRPGTTVRTADILLLCTVQERRMPTRQAGRHTMLALQLLLLRSTSRLFVLRSGGRWSVRCRPRRLSGGEPSLPIWTRPESWFNQNSTPGSPSTCAASLLAHDRTLTYTHSKYLHQGDSRQKYKVKAIIAYCP